MMAAGTGLSSSFNFKTGEVPEELMTEGEARVVIEPNHNVINALARGQFGAAMNVQAQQYGTVPNREIGLIAGAGMTHLQNPAQQYGTVPNREIGLIAAAGMAHLQNEALLQQNNNLHEQLRRTKDALANSKFETAELYSKIGELAEEWKATVNQLKKTNEQLRQENSEMKKIIEKCEKMIDESEREKQKLKVGQIGYHLEKLVSQYIFHGEDRDSKRARYGFQLRDLQSAKNKIDMIKNTTFQEDARKRLDTLSHDMSGMFEDWFSGIVEEIKQSRVGIAHPNLGSYEEMKEIIEKEFKDDDEKQRDILAVLDHLHKMCALLQQPFGVPT